MGGGGGGGEMKGSTRLQFFLYSFFDGILLFCSSQCSTTVVTNVVVHAILSVGRCI